jgi:hypothetical protein
VREREGLDWQLPAAVTVGEDVPADVKPRTMPAPIDLAIYLWLKRRMKGSFYYPEDAERIMHGARITTNGM